MRERKDRAERKERGRRERRMNEEDRTTGAVWTGETGGGEDHREIESEGGRGGQSQTDSQTPPKGVTRV